MKSIDQYMLEIKRTIEDMDLYYTYDKITINVPKVLWKKGNFELVDKYSPDTYIECPQENYFEIKASCFDVQSGGYEIIELIMIENDN